MPDTDTLDGLVTFYASHHALRAEKVLGQAGFEVSLTSGPKELSPNCGVALRIEFERRDDVVAVLEDKHVRYDEIIEYVPRTEEWTGRRRRSLLGRRRDR